MSFVTDEGELRKPKIKDGLKDQTIVKTKPVKLTAVITGDPAPEITWYCFIQNNVYVI